MGLIINPRQIIKDGITSLRDVWSSSKVRAELSGKQPTLVSGVNIKTVNTHSLLGSGDITISGGGDIPKINMTATTATLDPNKFYVWGEVASLDISLAAETAGIENVYKFQFQSGTTATTLTLPNNVVWDRNDIPSISRSSKYIISIVSNIAKIDYYYPQLTYQSYKQTGLVLQLDGLEQGNTLNKWVDLISGREFTPSSNTVEFNPNNITLDGTNYLYCDSQLKITNVNYTIEVCIDTYQLNFPFYIYDGGENQMALFACYSNQVTPTSTSGFGKNFTYVATLDNHCFSATSDMLVVDRDQHTTSASGGASVSGSRMYVGCRSYGVTSNFTGKIHAIRIYNQKLTLADIIENQQIDKIRFGL